MSKTGNTMRAAVGICCLLLAVLALGWLIGHYIPGEPRKPQAHPLDRGTGAVYYGSLIDAETIAGIAFGATYTISDLTAGNKFSTSESELANMTDDERLRTTTSESWEHDYPNLEIKIADAKTISMDAFKEWYPHYAAVDHRTPSRAYTTIAPDARVFLVEVEIANKGDASAMLPEPLLWSSDIAGADERLSNGLHCDPSLIKELYGEPSDEFIPYELPDDWNILEAGEVQTRIYPYMIQEGDLVSGASLENPDLSDYCLAFSDYDPPTIYRFWLA